MGSIPGYAPLFLRFFMNFASHEFLVNGLPNRRSLLLLLLHRTIERPKQFHHARNDIKKTVQNDVRDGRDLYHAPCHGLSTRLVDGWRVLLHLGTFD